MVSKREGVEGSERESTEEARRRAARSMLAPSGAASIVMRNVSKSYVCDQANDWLTTLYSVQGTVLMVTRGGSAVG